MSLAINFYTEFQNHYPSTSIAIAPSALSWSAISDLCHVSQSQVSPLTWKEILDLTEINLFLLNYLLHQIFK